MHLLKNTGAAYQTGGHRASVWMNESKKLNVDTASEKEKSQMFFSLISEKKN